MCQVRPADVSTRPHARRDAPEEEADGVDEDELPHALREGGGRPPKGGGVYSGGVYGRLNDGRLPASCPKPVHPSTHPSNALPPSLTPFLTPRRWSRRSGPPRRTPGCRAAQRSRPAPPPRAGVYVCIKGGRRGNKPTSPPTSQLTNQPMPSVLPSCLSIYVSTAAPCLLPRPAGQPRTSTSGASKASCVTIWGTSRSTTARPLARRARKAW